MVADDFTVENLDDGFTEEIAEVSDVRPVVVLGSGI